MAAHVVMLARHYHLPVITSDRETGAPPFGADAERLVAAVAIRRARLGERGYVATRARRAAMTDDEAVAFALASIEGAARERAILLSEGSA